MTIAVDQTKLRRLVKTILVGEELDRAEASTILEMAQLAAGADHEEDSEEHAVLQALAQQIYSLVGLKRAEVSAIEPVGDRTTRAASLRALAADLHTRAARELSFAVAFLVTIADLDLAAEEHGWLEDLQRALGVSDQRATDIVVLLSEVMSSDQPGDRGITA